MLPPILSQSSAGAGWANGVGASAVGQLLYWPLVIAGFVLLLGLLMLAGLAAAFIVKRIGERKEANEFERRMKSRPRE